MQSNFIKSNYYEGSRGYLKSSGSLADLSKNKKNSLILFGSPKLNGHTAKALNILTYKLSNNYTFKNINAYEENIHPCMDCGLCISKNACQFDDFNEIHNYLAASELLIIATPVYNLSFPAPLKAIFDRMQRYFCARLKRNIRPTFALPKQAIVLLTQGSNDLTGIDIITCQLKLIFSIIDTKLTAKIILQNTDHGISIDTINYQIEKAIEKLK